VSTHAHPPQVALPQLQVMMATALCSPHNRLYLLCECYRNLSLRLQETEPSRYEGRPPQITSSCSALCPSQDCSVCCDELLHERWLPIAAYIRPTQSKHFFPTSRTSACYRSSRRRWRPRMAKRCAHRQQAHGWCPTQACCAGSKGELCTSRSPPADSKRISAEMGEKPNVRD
jgi:hypothetical protein